MICLEPASDVEGLLAHVGLDSGLDIDRKFEWDMVIEYVLCGCSHARQKSDEGASKPVGARRPKSPHLKI